MTITIESIIFISIQMWWDLDKKVSLKIRTFCGELYLEPQWWEPFKVLEKTLSPYPHTTVNFWRGPTECQDKVNLKADSTDNKGDVLQRQRERDSSGIPAVFTHYICMRPLAMSHTAETGTIPCSARRII